MVANPNQQAYVQATVVNSAHDHFVLLLTQTYHCKVDDKHYATRQLSLSQEQFGSCNKTHGRIDVPVSLIEQLIREQEAKKAQSRNQRQSA